MKKSLLLALGLLLSQSGCIYVTAVKSTQGKAYVVKADNTIDVRDVKLGDRFPQQVEILEGVEDGESVALSSLTRLDAGSKVRIQTGEEKAAPATK